MRNNSEENNLTLYEKVWKKMREEINVKASEYVPQMYEALKKDGYTPDEARDKIKKDSINIWKKETIDKWIPEEAKKEILVTAGKKGAEIKTQKRLDSQSRVIQQEPEPKPQYQESPDLKEFRETKAIPQQQQDAIVIMTKRQAMKFINELRVDVLGRMSENSSIEFKINDGQLSYIML